jgi:O-antigen ligase
MSTDSLPLMARIVADRIWLIGFASLPVVVDPLRLSAHEAPQATFSVLIGLAILIAAILFGISQPFRSTVSHFLNQPISIAVLCWTLSVIVSGLFSISPNRSILGDLQRRMGVLTQLSFCAAFLGGLLITRKQQRHVWGIMSAVGCIVAGYGILQSIGGVFRPGSTLGLATFSASWVAIVILCLLVVILGSWSRRNHRYGLVASCVMLGFFLILNQSRGAMLGLIVGLVTLGLLWVWSHYTPTYKRRIAFGLGGATVLAISLVLLVGFYVRTQSNGPNLSNIEANRAAQRLSLTDGSILARLILWQTAGPLAVTWPTLYDVDGQMDRYARLRPLLGYGQESFQFVLEPRLTKDLRNTYGNNQYLDRAHNLIMEILITQGIAGLVCLLAIYVTVAWTCLRVVWRQRDEWDQRGWLAAGMIAVLVCHFIDLQFGFVGTASEWLMFGMMGLMVSQNMPRHEKVSSTNSNSLSSKRVSDQATRSIIPLIGWLTAWPLAVGIEKLQLPSILSFLNSTLLSVGLICLCLCICGVISRETPRTILLRLILALALSIVIHSLLSRWIQGAMVRADFTPAYLLLAADHAVYLIGAAMLAINRPILKTMKMLRLRYAILAVLILVLAGVWWVGDASGDALFFLGHDQPNTIKQAEAYTVGLSLKLPDDRLSNITALAALVNMRNTSGQERRHWIDMTCQLTQQAQRLNPFDLNTPVIPSECNG